MGERATGRSGMNNFGVELFLKSFLGYAETPRPMESQGEGLVAPEAKDFSGFVFKLQANMDAKHRDRVAFLRIVSGTFERGMKVTVARTGKTLALTRPQKMFATVALHTSPAICFRLCAHFRLPIFT
ncbi:hypothetical protein CYMTET_25411 [Cymbomonas tetramitiformis]|uniref:Elongation factor G-like domain-containing protein n=1 Tax=Cymbomonas tetramitiformis TaxID=36881 RepID=A0AAE0FUK1_9CHLO|nr:hypothetical protein CYMTET_25411 [Cymbomonas tetramitiformis]